MKNIDFEPINKGFKGYELKPCETSDFESINLEDLIRALNNYLNNLRTAYKISKEKLGKILNYSSTLDKTIELILGNKYDEIELLFDNENGIITFKTELTLMNDIKFCVEPQIISNFALSLSYNSKQISDRYIEDNYDAIQKIFNILEEYANDGYFCLKEEPIEFVVDDGFLELKVCEYQGEMHIYPKLSPSFGNYNEYERLIINENLASYVQNHFNITEIVNKFSVPFVNLSPSLRVFAEDKVIRNSELTKK